jgi:hypothetical protein
VTWILKAPSSSSLPASDEGMDSSRDLRPEEATVVAMRLGGEVTIDVGGPDTQAHDAVRNALVLIKEL